MNKTDQKFFAMIDNIKGKTDADIFNEIALGFLSLPNRLQAVYERYFEKYPFWGSLCTQKGDFDEIQRKAQALSHHADDFVWLYDRLADYSSKQLLQSILANWFKYDIVSINGCIEKKYDQYCDFDIIPRLENEVFVDLGAYTGDSVQCLAKNYGSNCFEKIFCYEITEEILPILEQNLHAFTNVHIKNMAASDKVGFKYFEECSASASANRTVTDGARKVKCTTLDRDIKTGISFIKMDIEGDELSAIAGSKVHLAREKPKLAVAVYHHNDHLWQIPRQVVSINPEYKLFLRYYGGNIYPTEIVLYAI